MRTTMVRLPNDAVVTRKSKTRVYEWAVVRTTDLRAQAQRLRSEAEVAQTRYERVLAIVESGELAQFERRVTSVNGFGQQFYSSYVPGDVEDGYSSLPASTTDA